MPTVLVVEDEAPILILAESVLQHAGYDTVSAASLAEAQAIIQSDERLDLVFTDVVLGNQKEAGLQIGQMVRDARNGTPVLYTSGNLATDGMRSLFVMPCEFLPKPYRDDELLSAVARLLNEVGSANEGDPL